MSDDASYRYHAALSLISRQVVLRSSGNAYDSLEFMQSYFPLSGRVTLSRAHTVAARYPDVLSKHGSSTLVVAPSDALWTDDKRGDICFYSTAMPAFRAFLDYYECRVLWNYSTVVSAAADRWAASAAREDTTHFLVQHTTRIAGGDYIIIKSTLGGMRMLITFLRQSTTFKSWDAGDPLTEALSDARSHWAKKWFMAPETLAASLRLAETV